MTVYTQLKNDGSIHMTPKGKIILENWRGKIIAEKTVNIQNRKVLPGEKWKEKNVFDKISIWNFGPIRARLVMHFGVSDQVLEGEATFWYIPVSGIIILAGIGIGGILLFFLRRRF